MEDMDLVHPIRTPPNSPNPTQPPVYSGVKEVLVNQPVTLKGRYDAQRIKTVTIAAEDRVALKVTLNEGSWQVAMPKGFSNPGARWLRLKGFDAAGKIVENRIFYLTVSTDPLTIGQGLQLKTLRDTYFKVSPTDSGRLTEQQKIPVRAGQTLTVERYGFLDGHLKVELTQAIAPIGDFGYFYEEHVQLSKGTQILRFDLEDVPETTLSAHILITKSTLFKTRAEDSALLQANQKVDLLQGQSFQIVGYACTRGHWRVTLAQPIAGIGNRGFIYSRHAQVKRNGQEIPYDSSALTIAALRDTVFKKRPIDATKLAAQERTAFNRNTFYGVSSYRLEAGHLKVSLSEEIPGFGNTGYVFPDFVQMRRGNRSFNPNPTTVEMSVPYLSQRDNPRLSWATCNVTAIAMVMQYYGTRAKGGGQLEDELLQWCLNKGGQDAQTNHSVLTELIHAYGYRSSFSTTRTWQQVNDQLLAGHPVVLCGYFTQSGHIVVLIGYTSNGYIVNDPWGNALSGYRNTEGRKLVYPFGYVKEICGVDGDVWAHFIDRS